MGESTFAQESLLYLWERHDLSVRRKYTRHGKYTEDGRTIQSNLFMPLHDYMCAVPSAITLDTAMAIHS